MKLRHAKKNQVTYWLQRSDRNVHIRHGATVEFPGELDPKLNKNVIRAIERGDIVVAEEVAPAPKPAKTKTKKAPAPKAAPEAASEELDALRARVEELTGKAPHHRRGVSSLRDEITKLEAAPAAEVSE